MRIPEDIYELNEMYKMGRIELLELLRYVEFVSDHVNEFNHSFCHCAFIKSEISICLKNIDMGVITQPSKWTPKRG